MTTYYIDATGGADGNNGTSPATAWQFLGKIDAGSFSAGDQILLKRGETWTCSGSNYIYCGVKNGAAGNPIIIGAYGQGALPVINGNSAVDDCVKVIGCTYITVQDILAKNATYNNFHVVAGGGSDTTNIIFKRCKSISAGRDNFSAESNLAGVKADAVEYWDCEATLSSRANYFAGTWQPSTYGCHYYRCKSTYAGQGEDSHGFTAFEADQVFWEACESSYTCIDPADGTDLYPAGGEGIGFCFDDASNNGWMKYCYSHHNRLGCQAAHFAAGNLIAYNNISHNKYGVVINGAPSASSNVLIYNNTIAYNWGTPAGAIWGWSSVTGLVVKNNLIAFNEGHAYYFDAGVTSPVVDYNLTYSNTNGVAGGGGAPTPTHAVTGNPSFRSANDLTLLAGSAAINAGVTIAGAGNNIALRCGSQWPYQVRIGDQNNYGSGWDIGAYIYNTGDTNMLHSYEIRVRETTTTTGTGVTLSLAGPVAGHQPISSIGADGTTANFMLEDANGTAWEYFIGTIVGTGTQVERTSTIKSTNGNSSINLSSGTHKIFLMGELQTPGWYNVKQFGAKGDGSTDDTAAIQRAIDAAQADHPLSVTVYFPAGIYIINNSLVVTDAAGICIRGENGAEFNSGIASYAHGSIIKQGASWPGTTTGSLKFVTTAANSTAWKGGIWVEGLVFWCGANVEGGGHGIHVVGSTNAGNSMVRFVNVTVRNGNKGIFFDDSTATGWQEVYVQNCKLEENIWGFYGNATINITVFRDSSIRQNALSLGSSGTLSTPTGGGILMGGSTTVLVEGCDLEGNQCSIKVNAVNVTISSCYFEACIDTAIVLNACKAVTIDNNYMIDGDRIYLTNSSNVSITRCQHSGVPIFVIVGKGCRDIIYDQPQFIKFDFDGRDLTPQNKGYYVWSTINYDSFPRPPHAVLYFPTTFPALTNATLAGSTALGPSGERSHIVELTATSANGKTRMQWAAITCVAGEYIVLTARIKIPTTNTGTTLNWQVLDAVNGAGIADTWEGGAGVQTLDSDSIARGEWITFQWVYLVQSGVTSYAAALDLIIPTSGDKLQLAGNAGARVIQPVIQPDLQYFGSTQAFQRNADAWRGAAVPSDTTLSWLTDERVIRDPPATGQPKAWSCTVAGSPGTWVSEGNL